MRSFEIQAQCFLVDIHIIIFTAMDRFQILKGPQNNRLTINFGSYGQVKLGRDLQTGKIVAIKMIYKLAESQMLLHPKLSHPNIISLIDIHFDISKQTTYLILEYSEEGPLSDKIKIGKLKKAEIKKYFKEVCQALAYLHQKKIMHRDVKPQNILITNTNQTKLNDFGVATFASAPKTVCGSYEHMAPEMILNKPYDHKVDVWALGILLFEMIGGNAPFRGNQPEIVLKQMKTKIYFGDNFDKQDISLIKYLLRVNPKNRPEVAELLKHSYFTSEEKIQNISSTTTTQQVSCRGNSHQLFSEILNSKPIVELPNRIEMMSKKQIYSDIYLSQQTKPKKGQRTQSCFDQNLKSQEKINYRIPSFIPRTQKIIEPLQIDFFAKIEQKTQPQSPTSPLTFRKKNSKATTYN